MTDKAQIRRKKFVNYYEAAVQTFMASGITVEQIQSLQDFGLMAKDNVTGYYEGRSGKGRFWTLKEAIKHAKETNEHVYYIEMDLRNLGGLNTARGHTKANEVYSAIAAIARSELSVIASETAFFRHGGDETCAFLVNTTEEAIRSAIDRVQSDVAKLAAEYEIHDIPHPKHGDNENHRGIGLYFGMVQISVHHENDPTLVFRQADVELARGKANAVKPLCTSIIAAGCLSIHCRSVSIGPHDLP